MALSGVVCRAQWRDIDEMRACELANGRSAMLATVGWVWPQVFGLWKGGQVTTTDPIDAIMQVPTAAWVQIIFLCGAIEANKYNWQEGVNRNSARVFYDPLSIYPEDPAGQARVQLQELKNARLAMLGFAGMFIHHFIPGAVPGLGNLH